MEEVVRKDAASKPEDTRSFTDQKSEPLTLRDIRAEEEPRIDTRDAELNRVLGGGLVPASVVLIGGEPGIGKSTLVLQTALKLKGLPILYVSGEESARQLKPAPSASGWRTTTAGSSARPILMRFFGT